MSSQMSVLTKLVQGAYSWDIQLSWKTENKTMISNQFVKVKKNFKNQRKYNGLLGEKAAEIWLDYYM